MTIIAEHGHILLILVCVFGFFMAWGIGANDVANAMGTSVGSKALTIKQAILIACIFEFAGAYLAGGDKAFPKERVERLTASSSDVMTFLVSGGVSGRGGDAS